MLLAGLLWRIVRYAMGFPIWGDEAFIAVNFITRDFAGMIRPLDYGQIAPLAFMWVELAITRVLGLSEWALRLLPFAVGVASLLLFWRFVRDTLPRRPALLALGIFAAGFYIVRHSGEVKPYETDLLVALGLTMLGWSVFNRPQSFGRWIVLIALAAAAPWCSYPSVFAGGAVGFLLTWLLIRASLRPSAPQCERGTVGRKNPSPPALGPNPESKIQNPESIARAVFLGWSAYGVVLLGSFAAMYFAYAQPHAVAAAHLTEISMWAQAFPPLMEPAKLLTWLLGIHTGLMFAHPYGGTAPGSIVTFVLFVIGAAQLTRTNRPLLLLLLGPLPLAFVAAAFKAYPYGGSARTMLYFAPAICLLAGLGWYTMLSVGARYAANTRARPARARRRRSALAVSALALAAFAAIMSVSDMVRPYSTRAVLNSHRAVRAIAARTAPADRWITFNAVKPVDYAPYLGNWRGVGGQFVFDAMRFKPVSLDWAPPPEQVELPPGGRLWLLVYRGYKVPFPQAQFDAYLGAIRQRLGEPRFDRFIVKTRIRNTTQPSDMEGIDVYIFGPTPR